MKKNIKMFVGILIGIIISAVVGVSATILYQADEVGFTPDDPNWNVNNLEDALNDLYNNRGNSVSKFCTFQTSVFGDANNHLSVGSKYSCDPGDVTPRNFYILEVRENTVDLIMEENINTGTMTWYNAMKYFDNDPNGISIKNSWTNVLNIDLPKAQAIVNAVGRSDWKAVENSNDNWWYLDKNGNSWGQNQVANASNLSSWRWLFNYTQSCTNYGCDSLTSLDSSGAWGYWTRDRSLESNNIARSWRVRGNGNFGADFSNEPDNNGVRPVITVIKDNLQG